MCCVLFNYIANTNAIRLVIANEYSLWGNWNILHRKYAQGRAGLAEV